MIERVEILDTTFREGLQFAGAYFTLRQKLQIARLLDNFGVEYIEVGSPVVSDRALSEIRELVKLKLHARIMAHCRVHRTDIERALNAGVQGINLYMGTSPQLRKHSHGRDMNGVVEAMCDAVQYIRDQAPHVFIRFSTEDAFRTDPVDLMKAVTAADELGVDRIGLPDTVGIATPMGVYERVLLVRSHVKCALEFHGHNDTGCAIANALSALEAGATCINTTVLGIGERNGITPLSGLVARLYTIDRRLVQHYRLTQLRLLDEALADMLGMAIPHDMPITSPTAFNHKAGVHLNAVLNEPGAYEVLNPDDFGITRTIEIASAITGKNAINHRSQELGITLSNEALLRVTSRVREAAETGRVNLADVDAFILEESRAGDGDTTGVAAV